MTRRITAALAAAENRWASLNVSVANYSQSLASSGLR